MRWGWLKRFMPRGLYGRAAMILIVPIVTLQLVVSIAFLQRHFEDVTGQLTYGLGVELQLLRDELAEGGLAEAAGVAESLGIEMAEGASPDWVGDEVVRRRWYDLSGRVVVDVLLLMVPEISWIDLAEDDKQVQLGLSVGGESVEMTLTRRRVSASNPHQLLVLMIFTGILMTTVAFLFLRNQVRPIRRLARAAEAFGKGRVLDYSPRGALEVRAAGRAFLDMRARIERQIEQRTMMLSGVSHDLRTPLTRMKLGLTMLEQGAETDALIRDVEEMEALLTAFLDFARSDALDDPEEVDVLALARQVAEDAGRMGGRVELVLPDAVPLSALRPWLARPVLKRGAPARRGTDAKVDDVADRGRPAGVRPSRVWRWGPAHAEPGGPVGRCAAARGPLRGGPASAPVRLLPQVPVRG